MAATKTQNYGNHTRWSVLHHFIAQPLIVATFVAATMNAWREPTMWNLWIVVFTLALEATALSARVMALTVQNRVIRLEMRLHLREVLPAPLAARIGELKLRHLVGLRFAGDAELPKLVERCLAGEFARTRDLKQAITDWQPDWLRA